MKRRSYYILLIGLIIIGIVTINFYQRKQEERTLAFEGYEISTIADRVNALYNEEKTDIADDLTDEEFEDLEIILEDLSTKDLTNSSEKDIQSMHVEFLEARDMYTIQNDIENLFEQKIIIRTVNLDKVSKLENKLEAYTTRTVYYDRNKKLVEEANEQLTIIKEARNFVENLHDDEGNLRADLTQEELDEAQELINLIKNNEIKAELAGVLDGGIIIIDEEELEQETDIVEDPEVEGTPETSSGTGTSTDSGPTSRPRPGNNTGSSGSTGNNSGTGSSGGIGGNSNNDRNPGNGNGQGTGNVQNPAPEETPPADSPETEETPPTQLPEQPDPLFYSDRLGQIPGLINVTAPHYRNVVRKNLQGNDCQHRRYCFVTVGYFNNMIRHLPYGFISFTHHRNDLALPGLHLLNVTHHLLVALVLGCQGHHRHLFIDEGNGSVLHFCSGIAFCMDVRNFLKF